jgi:hypothetical protein
MADGQRAGLTFISGQEFGWVGVAQDNGGARHIAWADGDGPPVKSNDVWLRGVYDGDTGKLLYSLDGGKTFADTGVAFHLKFADWKGARIGIFSYGGDGAADFDYVHYNYGTK